MSLVEDMQAEIERRAKTELKLTRDQQSAMDDIAKWLVTAAPGSIYRLFGLAGCGKTTCSANLKKVQHPVRKAPLRVLYVAFTNRAVSVLADKGCVPARTIHSILYETQEFDEEEKAAHKAMKQAYLEAVLAGIEPSKRPPLPPSTKRVGFSLRTAEDLAEQVKDFDVIAVDEASMVGGRQGKDLLLLNRPIIGIGDPGQLKPVGDVPFFRRNNPETLLTEILRQKKNDKPGADILDLAMHVRNGGGFSRAPATGVNYEIRRKAPVEWFDYDQVICGIHDKRRQINAHIRGLRGFNTIYPVAGEKVLAVSNNKNEGIINGQLWTVTDSSLKGDYVVMDLVEYAPRKAAKDLDIRFGVEVHVACFQKDIKDATEMGIDVRYDSCLMTWGYCITVHKSQGSEWNSVLLFDDGPIFRDQVNEWRYTGITRAASQLGVISRHE